MGNEIAAPGCSNFVKAAGRALVLAALALSAAHAQEPAPVAPLPTQVEETDLGRLEGAFWACDFIATTRGVQATPIAVCRYVTEELKQQKFGGSYGQFLEWWRANKSAEHQRMARLVEP